MINLMWEKIKQKITFTKLTKSSRPYSNNYWQFEHRQSVGLWLLNDYVKYKVANMDVWMMNVSNDVWFVTIISYIMQK